MFAQGADVSRITSMCGRFTLAIDLENLLGQFLFPVEDLGYTSRYNIAPTQQVLTYGAQGPNTAEYMRWGLIPMWKKPEQKLPLMINARGDKLASSGVFKRPLQRQRCLILADSFYEWQGKEKTPMRIGLKGWEPFGLAGLWDSWHDPEKGEAHSCTIITCPPNELMQPIHDRMPVIVPPELQALWLDRGVNDLEALMPLLRPYPSDEMEAYEVSRLVNSVKNESAALLSPAE
jgi:putative SOS response-associated peptidase YedK